MLIIDLLDRMENDDNWIKGYIPQPTNYLEGERWEDELSKAPTEKKTSLEVIHESALKYLEEKVDDDSNVIEGTIIGG
jgi:hypothetical protein